MASNKKRSGGEIEMSEKELRDRLIEIRTLYKIGHVHGWAKINELINKLDRKMSASQTCCNCIYGGFTQFFAPCYGCCDEDNRWEKRPKEGDEND